MVTITRRAPVTLLLPEGDVTIINLSGTQFNNLDASERAVRLLVGGRRACHFVRASQSLARTQQQRQGELTFRPWLASLHTHSNYYHRRGFPFPLGAAPQILAVCVRYLKKGANTLAASLTRGLYHRQAPRAGIASRKARALLSVM